MKQGWITFRNTKYHYVNDKLHNDNGPAEIHLDSAGNVTAEFWFENGLQHRDGAPATYVFTEEGIEFYWFYNGKRHREYGPSVDLPNGYKQWYYYGKMFETEEEYEAFLKFKAFI